MIGKIALWVVDFTRSHSVSIYSCKIKSQRLKFEGEANSLHLNFQEQRDIISYPYVASRDDDGTQR